MLDGKVIASLCLKVPLCSEDMSALFSYTEKIRADGFRAGAASRDAYIEQLELALLQVRKAICGDIHNTDDLLDLIASRDAEVVSLTNQRDYEYVRAENAEQERDQLRTEMNEWRGQAHRSQSDADRLKEQNWELISEKAPALVAVRKERDQLRAQINMLREALEGQVKHDKYVSYERCPDCDFETKCSRETGCLEIKDHSPIANKALSSTPEQSIAEHRNKVIEAFVNEFSRHVGGDGEFWLHELQDFAMKEQP